MLHSYVRGLTEIFRDQPVRFQDGSCYNKLKQKLWPYSFCYTSPSKRQHLKEIFLSFQDNLTNLHIIPFVLIYLLLAFLLISSRLLSFSFFIFFVAIAFFFQKSRQHVFLFSAFRKFPHMRGFLVANFQFSVCEEFFIYFFDDLILCNFAARDDRPPAFCPRDWFGDRGRRWLTLRVVRRQAGNRCLSDYLSQKRPPPSIDRSGQQFTQYLKTFLKTIPHVVYQRQKGFWNCKSRFHHRDGIHLLNNPGQLRCLV